MREQDIILVLDKLERIIKVIQKNTYSLEEAAQYLKISPESVEYYSKRQKQLSHVNLGGQLVFRKQDLDEFLEKKLKIGIFF